MYQLQLFWLVCFCGLRCVACLERICGVVIAVVFVGDLWLCMFVFDFIFLCIYWVRMCDLKWCYLRGMCRYLDVVVVGVMCLVFVLIVP